MNAKRQTPNRQLVNAERETPNAERENVSALCAE